MMLTVAYLAIAIAITTLANALPLDAVQRGSVNLEPRAKSYSVINVDGGSTAAPEPSSTVDDSTKTKVETVKVTETPAVVTDTLRPTATPAPAPATTSSSSTTSSSAPETKPSSTSHLQSSTSTARSPTTLLAPSVVTVVVTETRSPAAVSTEYYDDGQWHTRYIVKTFGDAAVATAAPSSISSDALSSVLSSRAFATLDSATVSYYNHTQIPRR